MDKYIEILERTPSKAVVKFGHRYFVVSDNGKETLIFPSDKDGHILSYVEVGGGGEVKLWEVVSDFSRYLKREHR